MTKTLDFILRSRRVLVPHSLSLPESEIIVRDASILVRDEKILDILPFEKGPSDWPVLEVGNSVIMPGLIDTHIHINEPGRTEWEGFETATRAAAAGGITTLVDMPLNSIPATTSVNAFQTKIQAAEGHCWVDYGFWGGLVPENLSELAPLAKAGILGFKCFLIDSGVDEFAKVSPSELRTGMQRIAETGLPLLVHAELELDDHPEFASESSSMSENSSGSDPSGYLSYLQSRPRKWENDAIHLLIELSRETRCRVHIVHLSCADRLDEVARARKEGVPITVETCPHYLTLCAEDILPGATHFKCAPPIREKENQARLWAGLREGTIDLVVSDHSPCSPHLKLLDLGNFSQAWGGISSLQFSLPLVWTESQKSNTGLGLCDIPRLMSRTPAILAGLSDQKGCIAPGMDADFVVWNPEAGFKLEASQIHHRHTLTPYLGKTLQGVVEISFLRGRKIFDRGNFCKAPLGRALFNKIRHPGEGFLDHQKEVR